MVVNVQKNTLKPFIKNKPREIRRLLLFSQRPGVSQPAVTDMLKNLESKGLIDYKSSKGQRSPNWGWNGRWELSAVTGYGKDS